MKNRIIAFLVGLLTAAGIGVTAAPAAHAENPFNPPGQVCLDYRSNVSVYIHYTSRRPGVDKYARHYTYVQRGTCTSGWWDVNGYQVPSSRTDVVVYNNGFRQSPGWHGVGPGITKHLITAFR